jgi:hypothetical protein
MLTDLARSALHIFESGKKANSRLRGHRILYAPKQLAGSLLVAGLFKDFRSYALLSDLYRRECDGIRRHLLCRDEL